MYSWIFITYHFFFVCNCAIKTRVKNNKKVSIFKEYNSIKNINIRTKWKFVWKYRMLNTIFDRLIFTPEHFKIPNNLRCGEVFECLVQFIFLLLKIKPLFKCIFQACYTFIVTMTGFVWKKKLRATHKTFFCTSSTCVSFWANIRLKFTKTFNSILIFDMFRERIFLKKE